MGKKRCLCDTCLAHDPHGRDIDAQLYCRHHANASLKRKLEILEEAGQESMRMAIASSDPSLVSALSATADRHSQDIHSPVERHRKARRTEASHSPKSAAAWALDIHEPQSVNHQLQEPLLASLKGVVDMYLPEVMAISPPTWLQFAKDPLEEDPMAWEGILSDLHSPAYAMQTHRAHFLLTDHPINHRFNRSEMTMRTSLIYIQQLEYMSSCSSIGSVQQEIGSFKSILLEALNSLLCCKRDLWFEQLAIRKEGRTLKSANEINYVVETGRFLRPFQWEERNGSHPMVLSSMLSVLLLNLLFGLSHRQCAVMLDVLRHNLTMAAYFSKGHIPPDLAAHLPKTLDTVIRRAHIDPSLRLLMTCPQCHALYPSDQPYTYPMYCKARIGLDGPECQSHMTMKRQVHGKEVIMPIRNYLHHDIKEWVGRLLCRTDIEKMILENQEPPVSEPGGAVSSILGSRVIRNLRDRDGSLFLRRVTGEYRLIFALSVDGFNPFGNREAKQTRTCTGIYLTCLNLPLSERQKPCNVHLVGVIPGPNKPKEGELNGYLNLIAEDFLEYWDPGVTYSRTPTYEGGAICKGVVIPVICDGIGAREVSGFPTITSTPFCIYCELPINRIEDFDNTQWVPRTTEGHRRDAIMWRDANPETRDKLRKTQHPARYTALLKLPYFEPVTFTVIDTMHNLFLGLFKRHCRHVWGMNVKLEDGDGLYRSLGQIPSIPDEEDMEAGRLAFARIDTASIRKLKKGVLYYLCEEAGLRRGGKKADLLKELCRKASCVHESPVVPALPAITEDLIAKVKTAEDRFTRELSLSNFNTDTLLCMCHLRRLVFHYSKPQKNVMVQALIDWRQERTQMGGRLPEMDLAPLHLKAVSLSRQNSIVTSTAGSSRQSTPLSRASSVVSSRQSTPRPATTANFGEPTRPPASAAATSSQQSTPRPIPTSLPASQPTSLASAGSIMGQQNGQPLPPYPALPPRQPGLSPHPGVWHKDGHNPPSSSGQVNVYPAFHPHSGSVPQGSYHRSHPQYLAASQSHHQSNFIDQRTAAVPPLHPLPGPPAPLIEGRSYTSFMGTSPFHTQSLPGQPPDQSSAGISTAANTQPLSSSSFQLHTPRLGVQMSGHSSTQRTEARIGMAVHGGATVDSDSVTLPPPPVPPAKRAQTAVLGAGVLSEYKNDRQNMVLPPWVSRAPAKAGHPEHGKLSADQWRVLCTINLPVTLIRLWGTQDPQSRWYKMLRNFLDLVTAVEIASRTSITENDIKEYERLMHRYLTDLKELYQDASISPNHHIALHLGDIMRNFGPTPEYRAFFMERCNFTLQSVNTNRQSGEVEMTMMRTICRGANLIALIEHPDVKPLLGDLRRSLSALNDDQRGTRIHDAIPTNAETRLPGFGTQQLRTCELDADLFTALQNFLNNSGGPRYVPYDTDHLGKSAPGQHFLHTKAQMMPKVTLQGVQYHSHKSSIGASHVVVRLPTSDGAVLRQPAQIQHILRHVRQEEENMKDEIFIAVKYLQPLSRLEAANDPYRKFEHYGSLWKRDLTKDLYVIHPSQVVSHFARTEMTLLTVSSSPLYHVLPLDKVRRQFEAYGWPCSDVEHGPDTTENDRYEDGRMDYT
ncbi:hypothetical protein NMY22_g1789 [Coprinellus aureogranulatus]|nr:hypothetical protein NMY22_g1789 [Coprinellus aureogranulatus]